MRNWYIFFVFFLSAAWLPAQSLQIESTPSAELEVCEGPGSFQVRLYNIGGTTVSNPVATIALPSGIGYLPASLSEQTNYNVQAQNVSNNSALSFTASDLPAGDSIIFTISTEANADAVNFQVNGGVFRNGVDVVYTGGSDNHLSSSYNILYPALSILSINPSAQTILSGGNTTRTVTVINGGNGRASMIYLTDIRNSSLLTLDGADIGTLQGDTLVLSGSDFAGVGNGDAYLDQFESIVVTQTLGGTSCVDATFTSEIKAHWGCEGTSFSSTPSYGNITIDFQSPNLKLSVTEKLEACFGGGAASGQSLALRNTGSGIADGIFVELFKSTGNGYDQTIFSRIDPQSVQYKIGSNGSLSAVQGLVSTATQSTGDYACLGSSPVGKVRFELPSLAPGDTVFVEWDMYACCLATCQDDAVKGWEAEVEYTDVCGATPYSGSIKGQDRNNQYLTFFTESPIDLLDAVPENFDFIVSSFENTLPQGEGAAYKATFQLEAGLDFQSLRWHSNGAEWVPTSVQSDPANHLVTAWFPAQAPFTVPKSEIELVLAGACGNAGWKTISLDVSYVPDTTCAAACEIPLACAVQTTTYLQCPLQNCASLKVLDFSAQRISFGSPDNNLDGLPDAAGALDASKIKFNRAMVGDTVLATASAVVGTTADTWVHAGFTSNVNYGSVLECAEASVRIYDASNGSYHVASGLLPTVATSGQTRDFSYDLSVSNLSALQSSLNGFSYASGDSIWMDVKYRVAASVSGLLKETTFLNDFFLSDVANPSAGQKESCNARHGRLTLIGYGWRNNPANNVTVNACTKNITQYFGLSIGDFGSNYGGGNLFPYEYRHWAIATEAKVVIPPHYSHVNTTLRYYPTVSTNNTITQTLNNLSPDAISGDTLIYDLSQFFANGQLRLSDDGWDGRLLIEVAPSCDVPTNTYQNVEWSFDFEKTAAIDGLATGPVSAGSPDRIRYRPSSFLLSSNNPIQDAFTKKVNWDYKVQNTSTNGADHAWLHLETPQNIIIDSVTFDGGARLVQQNDIYLIGSIGANSTADMTIHATISGCDTVQLTAYSGFECTGFPATFADFACQYEQLELFVAPKESDYQQRIWTSPMANPCTPQVELVLEITSVKLAHMFDMAIDLVTPDSNKIKVVPGSSSFQYNTSNPYSTIADPSYAAGIYNYNINDYDASFADNGIPGVLDVSNNRYRLKVLLELGSAFMPGDFLQIQISGSNACGEELQTVELAFDPNAKFQKDNTAGLHLDIGDSWSASWGDYDNDGYDDLFVPVNDLSQPNILYHNNGDGTFTKASLPPITTDLGASIAGTWGDYDNDGHLDLFVANNINSSNKLYHNNGDGTFSSIENSPIVDEGVYSHAAAWADYNQDGFLDLVVSDFHPTHFNFLFQGNGHGGFVADPNSDVSLSATSAMGVAWGDYDGDGDADLFVANTNGENNQLYENIAGELELVTTGVVVQDGGSSVGGAWGDCDNDGDLDLFVTNSGATEANFFYANNGDGTFAKITSGALVAHVGNSHGASWIDFDNDGDLDLIVANDQDQQNFFFSNNGNMAFTKLTNAITEEQTDSYGTAWADYDADGDYDLFIANRGSNANDFFINEKGACTNHIAIDLEGCNSNSKGVGAMVRVKATLDGVPTWQSRPVSTQTSAMGGQNSFRLLFGLLDATTVDSVQVLWPSGIVSDILNPTINQLLTIQEACGAKVCGIVYHDANANGVQDSNEVGIPNHKLIVQPGGFQVVTDADGAYELYLQDGNFTIEQAPDSAWAQTFPIGNTGYPLSINLSNQAIYCGNDFGNQAICTEPDLSVTLGTTAFRRGLPNDLLVNVSNTGAYAATDSITLVLTMSDDLYMVDSLWTNVQEGGGQRVYTYGWQGLPALTDTLLHLVDSVGLGAVLGENIVLDAALTYAQSECNTGDNTFSMTDEVVGSIDPNDKQVMVKGAGTSRKAEQGDVLLYRIRFQNLGTYAARIVTLVDTLSDHLDWGTLVVESSSHPFNFSLVNGVATWVNRNIELPDSTSDPEGSQGYVTFSISPKKDLPPHTWIENRANIQFDYNGYIATNNTEILIDGRSDENGGPRVVVYPQPIHASASVMLVGEDEQLVKMETIEIRDLQGRMLGRFTMGSVRGEVDLAHLPAGIYILSVRSSKGIFRKQIVVGY